MESNRFVKLYKQGSTLGSSYLEIWVDRETGVQYLYRMNGSSRRRHTRFKCDWSSDVCSSDLCKKS